MSTQLQQAPGLSVLSEFNQCVILHLPAAYVWEEPGCPNQVPHRARIDSSASRLRLVEFQQASQCASKIADPLSQWEDGILIQAQNAMTPNHDGPLRGLPLFLHHGLAHIKEMTLRIIEIDSSGPASTIDMHIFGPNARDEISMDLTICVWGDRVTFLMPAPETTSDALAMWRDCFHDVYTYEWMDWREELGKLPSVIIFHGMTVLTTTQPTDGPMKTYRDGYTPRDWIAMLYQSNGYAS